MKSPAIPIAFAIVAIFCLSTIFVKVLFWAATLSLKLLPYLLAAFLAVVLLRRFKAWLSLKRKP